MQIWKVIWAMGKSKSRTDESRHFQQILQMAIRPVKEVVCLDSDPDFREHCSLQTVSGWEDRLREVYRGLRETLKAICYGSNADSGFLDGRKIAAVFCGALIQAKVFTFDLDQAKALMVQKKNIMSSVEFNSWLAQNVYLNYKLAYYVGLQLVYLTLLYDLNDPQMAGSLYGISESDANTLIVALNDIGHLLPYPSPPDADSFDVNVIIGLARADLTGQDFDMFLFAMQLYQLEMYTIERLKEN